MLKLFGFALVVHY